MCQLLVGCDDGEKTAVANENQGIMSRDPTQITVFQMTNRGMWRSTSAAICTRDPIRGREMHMEIWQRPSHKRSQSWPRSMQEADAHEAGGFAYTLTAFPKVPQEIFFVAIRCSQRGDFHPRELCMISPKYDHSCFLARDSMVFQPVTHHTLLSPSKDSHLLSFKGSVFVAI